MACIVRVLSFTASNASRRFPHARNLFTASGVGLDQYNRLRELTAVRIGSNIKSFRQNFKTAVESENEQIFTEDLKSMVYLAENDEEVDLVIKALKKYNQKSFKYSNYHFGSPIMRLLTHFRKTDKALEVYNTEEFADIFNDSASNLVLINHLLDEKRYEDAVKVFDKGLSRGFLTMSGKKVPTDVALLVIEALFHMNTKESFKKMQEIVKLMHDNSCNITFKTIGFATLLAVKQGRPDVALELTAISNFQEAPLIRNLRAICFADLNRIDDAFLTIKAIVEQDIRSVSENYNRRVYPLTMRHLRTAVEKTNDKALSARLEELVKALYEGRHIAMNDLEEFLLLPIGRRYFPRDSSTNANDRNDFGVRRRTNFQQSVNAQQSFDRDMEQTQSKEFGSPQSFSNFSRGFSFQQRQPPLSSQDPNSFKSYDSLSQPAFRRPDFAQKPMQQQQQNMRPFASSSNFQNPDSFRAAPQPRFGPSVNRPTSNRQAPIDDE